MLQRQQFSPDTLALLKAKGHEVRETNAQGLAEAIVLDTVTNTLEAGVDRRAPDGGAATP